MATQAAIVKWIEIEADLDSVVALLADVAPRLSPRRAEAIRAMSRLRLIRGGLRRQLEGLEGNADRALRIPLCEGYRPLIRKYFSLSPARSGRKPMGTQRGDPAGIAGTDLPLMSDL